MTALRTGRTRAAGWLRGRPRLVSVVVLTLLAGISLGAGLSLGTWRSVCLDCPSVAQIYVWEPKQSTKIFDRDAKLIAELFEERRTPIEIGTLPKHVPQAFVAVEDKRFYEHDGIDPRGIARAVITRRGGGSTITQQLARNMFTEGIGFERRGMAGLTRKLKEAKVAQQIEELYEKDVILQAYINQVNYGHGWRGIETASQHYFGKPAIDLNPAEAAMLAAAVNAPGRYSPFVNANATLRRRNLVLGLMQEQGFLSAEDAARWKEEPLPTTRHGTEVGRIAPYFVEWVRTILDSRYGDALYKQGLRVYTSLDLEIQRYAQAAMDSGWARIERMPAYKHPRYRSVVADRKRRASPESPYLQGLLVALDPATGEVRALVGGRDFADSKFNRATQALRQPGSTFKPFVYYTALNSGVPASQILYDAPQMIDMPDGTVYSPKNYDPDFRGPITLRDALKYSINTVTVRLGIDVGLESIAQTAREFGIRTTVYPYPSMTIGATEVVPLQLAEAYTVFATNGRRARARPILRVEDASGAVIWEPQAEIDQVAKPASVALARDLLQTALNNGTGYSVRDPAQGALPYTVPAAGKTGTTNDATDVWFAGFTPNLLAVVWFGFDKPQRIMTNAAGGVLAAPVWGRFMREVYTGAKPELSIPEAWPWPEGIVALSVDRETGRLANEWCPHNPVTEYFVSGTEPAEGCSPYSGGLFGTPPRMPGDTVRDTVRAPVRDTVRAPVRDTVRAPVRDTIF